jgi:uncharacterized lipoprotein YajG
MTQRIFIIVIIFLMIGCKTKQQTGQWNLNQTVGWKSVNPDDYAVIFIIWKQTTDDTSQISQKKRLDEVVLKELKTNRLGDQAENDEPRETDLHFVVSKDYKKAIAIIISVAKDFDVEQKVVVYKRDYASFDKWTDKIIYPK